MPDAGYCFGSLKVDEFSHRLAGSVGFCLPLGMVILWGLGRLRSPLVRRLPNRFREKLLPHCQQPFGSPLVLVVSLLVGVWTHLLWDSFTHKDGKLVQLLPLLQIPIAPFSGRTVRVHHLLWYASTFAGIAWVSVVYQRWLQTAVRASAQIPNAVLWRNAILLAASFLPVAAAHHVFSGFLVNSLVAAFTAAAAVVFAWKTGRDLHW